MIAAYHQPEALGAALDLIANGAVPIAGATGLYTGRVKRDHQLVDITRLGLNQIEISADAVRIGATVTLAELVAAAQIPATAGEVLRKVARGIASAPLRNMITVGGGIAHIVYWADMPVALLALDATVEVQRAKEKPVQIPIDFCLRDGKKTWDGGLITSVRVPLDSDKISFGYERFTRTASDYAFASACVTLRNVGGVAKRVRVVLGAVQGRPSRLASVEALVEGQAITPQLLETIEKNVHSSVQVAPNFRAPAEYRRELAAVLVGRALDSAWAQASREEG
ncbi:MAG TPA: FAD binding domain-containing protein [Polyangiaceae bacterium]|jgi:carbon-monoxide dehydrogenase medium subunit|nr:FAD binding domain-containing protein [Polyangiaceae bacterium]HNZ23281.1 FAD binding domain-containing protein [Polyangiaceae bacterium]HOD21949.1 FAD binding domain-containing protein [Polyangiaceae bacterium]HOE51496.1 FAD binding domain-containing protein [Polyangiaceae bacterium]HOH00981.1 FAD binding domain-containing protein [Polyangiaceae bacterium]